MYETFFKHLKGGEMFGCMTAAAALFWQFCGHFHLPQNVTYIGTAIVAVIAAAYYFINPKALEWAQAHPADPEVMEEMIQAAVGRALRTQPAPRNFSPPTPSPTPSPQPSRPLVQMTEAEETTKEPAGVVLTSDEQALIDTFRKLRPRGAQEAT